MDPCLQMLLRFAAISTRAQLLFLLLLVFVSLICPGLSNKANAGIQRHHITHVGNEPHSIPTVFWINLDGNTDRARHMRRQLSMSGFAHQVRVSAVTPQSSDFRVEVLEKPCKRNTDRDIAVILSHLKALYLAIYEDPQPNSKYALILEDDIRFLFSVNFTKLTQSAPPEFGVLQLTTSNHEASAQLYSLWQGNNATPFWYRTHWQMRSKNGKTYKFWSAQAYIVHKEAIRAAIDAVVHSSQLFNSSTSLLSFRIINSFFPQTCSFTSARPCVLSYCLFADSYIYSLCQPAYVASVPLVTGSRIGLNSTIHQAEVATHIHGFQQIHDIVKSVHHECRNISVGQELNSPCHRLPVVLGGS